MDETIRTAAISPLRQRLIDDMNMRRFSRATQHNYIRDVGRFATFLGRSPDTATADEVRRFQIEQRDAGVPTPTMNSVAVFAATYSLSRIADGAGTTAALARQRHERLQEEEHRLAGLCVTEVRIGGRAYYHQVLKPRDDVRRLLNAASIAIPTALPLAPARVATKKKLPQRRKVK